MVSFFIIALYLIYIIINYGIPHSISSTYYLIKNKFIFSLVLIASASAIVPDMIRITPDSLLFLIFLTFAGILSVAVSPNFLEDKFVDKVHTYGALATCLISLIWVACINPINLLWWEFVLLYIYILYSYYATFSEIILKTNIKFWAEIIMLLTIYWTVL